MKTYELNDMPQTVGETFRFGHDETCALDFLLYSMRQMGEVGPIPLDNVQKYMEGFSDRSALIQSSTIIGLGELMGADLIVPKDYHIEPTPELLEKLASYRKK
jgi:hypothetical protein